MEHSCLISDIPKNSTIRVSCDLIPNSGKVRKASWYYIILDSGSDNTTLSKEFLKMHANAFSFSEMNVGVFENWNNSKVVGVVGMDILLQLTFIMYHRLNKFLLTDEDIDGLREVFGV